MCEIFDQIREDGREEGREEVLEFWQESVCDLLKLKGELPLNLMNQIVQQENKQKLRQWTLLASKTKSIAEFERAIGI